jgi:hypothetical protein
MEILQSCAKDDAENQNKKTAGSSSLRKPYVKNAFIGFEFKAYKY